MAAEIPSDIPASLAAGTTWKWYASFADYPASEGWALAYYLRGVGVLTIADGETGMTVTADGDRWLVTAAATATTLTAGAYAYAARVSKAGEVFDVDAGTVTVTPNTATAAAGALQSHAERALALIEAKIEGRVVSDAESYTVLGRSISKTPIEQLYALRAKYQREVTAQRRGSPFEVVRANLLRPS